MFNQKYTGSVAPLALLFTLVSMSFTVAYLKNSFSQSAMEKYRYAEWRALYSAEAGLNDVGIIVFNAINVRNTPFSMQFRSDFVSAAASTKGGGAL